MGHCKATSTGKHRWKFHETTTTGKGWHECESCGMQTVRLTVEELPGFSVAPGQALCINELGKHMSYLEQENAVLHARVRKLEIALSSEREACAKVAEDLASNTPQLLLHSGEMEPQELLTSKAVLKLVASLIRGRGER